MDHFGGFPVVVSLIGVSLSMGSPALHRTYPLVGRDPSTRCFFLACQFSHVLFLSVMDHHVIVAVSSTVLGYAQGVLRAR